MDPVHFTAAQKIVFPDQGDAVQAFYDAHATDPFRRSRRLASLIGGVIRNRMRLREKAQRFAVRHPAE